MIYRIPVATESDECPYQPSSEHRLALPGLHGKQRLRIQSIERQRLALVTWNEVRQEVGHYRSRGAYQQAWVQRWDKAWVARQHAKGGVSPEDLERRFRTRWSGTDCWVLTFVLLEQSTAPKFMANQRRRPPGEGQYHWKAGKPYAIDPTPVVDASPEYVKQARLEGAAMRSLKAGQRAYEIALARTLANQERGKLRAQRYAG